jgi:chitinase
MVGQRHCICSVPHSARRGDDCISHPTAMTSQTFWLNELLSGSLQAGSSFWGGLSASFSITNQSGQSLSNWSFSFVSSYNNFDFYNADQIAQANGDGTYTITVSAAAGAPALAAGASLALGFTVNSDSDATVTLEEVLLAAGGSTTGGSGSGGTSSGGTSTGGTSTTDTSGGTTSSGTTSETTGSSGDSGTNTGGDGLTSSAGLSVEIKLGASWSGTYEGTLTVRNGSSGTVPAGWSISLISDHALRNISDFNVQQVLRSDGRYGLTLSAPSWAAGQGLAAGASLSTYFQASGSPAGLTVAELFEIIAPSGTATAGTGTTTDATGSGSSAGSTDTSSGSVSGTGSDSGSGHTDTGTASSGTGTSGAGGDTGSGDTAGSGGSDGSNGTSGSGSGSGSGDSGTDSGTGTGTVPGSGGTATSDTGSGGQGVVNSEAMRIVGYFEEWGIYGRDFRVADVKADSLTHLNYSFFGITPTQSDLPFMAAELNVLPGAMVQAGYLGLNSNTPGGLGIHDTWAAYEKTFTQADQLVSRRFAVDQWQGLSEERRQSYINGGDFDVSTASDGSRLVRAKADTWADSQGGIQRTFSKADWDGLSDARQAYLVSHSQDYSWTDQWQGTFNPTGSTTAQKIAAVDAHFAAGGARTLTLRADGDLVRNANAWVDDGPANWQKLYAGNLNQLRLLKQLHPDLNIGFAIGGWTLSGNFSTNLNDAAGRETFTQSIIDHLEYYDFFSSVDFDWEYPGGGGLASNALNSQDGSHLALTLQLLDQKLEALEARTGRSIEISIATAGGAEKLANLNLQGIDAYVDFYNVMTYDFHGGWESRTGHQAAMTGDAGGYDVVTAIDQFRQAGITMDKVVLGAPAYTRAWGGVAAGSSFGYGQNGDASLAPGSYEKGNYDQKDLITGIENGSYQLIWDDSNKAAFAYNPTSRIWSSVETTATIAGKAAYVQEAGLGGMMFWAISNDSEGAQSLIGAAHDALVDGTALGSIAGRAPGFDHVLGGDGQFSLADFTTLA